MPRYIDADETIELLRSLGSRDYRREKGTICDAIKMLQYPEYTPTADVVPKSEVALKVIKEVEQILTAKIINIEEDFFHGAASHWDATKRNCYEEVLVEIAELKKKYTEESK